MAQWDTSSVKNIIRDIKENIIVLPVIQRRLVWQEEKMELLFNSLLRGNSFGSIICIEEEKGEKPLFAYREFTRDGNNISAATGDSKDNLSKSIVKDDKGYVIDDTKKTITWSKFEKGYAENYTEYLAKLFYITNIEMLKSGKEKFGDKEMDYEEYKIIVNKSSSASSESSKVEEQHVKYYFDNKEFKGMKIINGNDYYALRIVSMTHEIPDGEFDYPSDYKLIQAEEYSYAVDGSSSAESSKASTSSKS